MLGAYLASLRLHAEERRAAQELRDALDRRTHFLEHALARAPEPARAHRERASRARARGTPGSEKRMGHARHHLPAVQASSRGSSTTCSTPPASRSGKMQVRCARIDLAEVVERTVRTTGRCSPAAASASTCGSPNRPLWMDGDAARLAQVVGNLLTNAAKFTNPGGRAEVSVAREVPGTAVVRVRDDGVGLAPDVRSRLFEPFAQGADTFDRNRGGLGLGLALAKGLVDLHGGTIAARSDDVGRGAELVVTLPLLAGGGDAGSAGGEPQRPLTRGSGRDRRREPRTSLASPGAGITRSRARGRVGPSPAGAGEHRATEANAPAQATRLDPTAVPSRGRGLLSERNDPCALLDEIPGADEAAADGANRKLEVMNVSARRVPRFGEPSRARPRTELRAARLHRLGAALETPWPTEVKRALCVNLDLAKEVVRRLCAKTRDSVLARHLDAEGPERNDGGVLIRPGERFVFRPAHVHLFVIREALCPASRSARDVSLEPVLLPCHGVCESDLDASELLGIPNVNASAQYEPLGTILPRKHEGEPPRAVEGQARDAHATASAVLIPRCTTTPCPPSLRRKATAERYHRRSEVLAVNRTVRAGLRAHDLWAPWARWALVGHRESPRCPEMSSRRAHREDKDRNSIPGASTSEAPDFPGLFSFRTLGPTTRVLQPRSGDAGCSQRP